MVLRALLIVFKEYLQHMAFLRSLHRMVDQNIPQRLLPPSFKTRGQITGYHLSHSHTLTVWQRWPFTCHVPVWMTHWWLYPDFIWSIPTSPNLERHSGQKRRHSEEQTCEIIWEMVASHLPIATPPSGRPRSHPNQTGSYPTKWDKTGQIVEVLQFDQ